MHFDFVTLRAFLMVADAENLRAASEQLKLSISAVSRRISDLEADSGSSFSCVTREDWRSLKLAGFLCRVRATPFEPFVRLRTTCKGLRPVHVARSRSAPTGQPW